MNRFMKVMEEAAQDHGVDLVVDDGATHADIEVRQSDGRVTEVCLLRSLRGWQGEVSEDNESVHTETIGTTAELSRFLRAWLG